jgi:hypothetical protein
VGAALAACAVCCAGPLLAVLAAVGVTAGVAAVAVPALAVVAVAAFGGVWWLRRRARARCAVLAAGSQELGLPTVGPPEDQMTGPASPAR